jgi:hypothetical protein
MIGSKVSSLQNLVSWKVRIKMAHLHAPHVEDIEGHSHGKVKFELAKLFQQGCSWLVITLQKANLKNFDP